MDDLVILLIEVFQCGEDLSNDLFGLFLLQALVFL
jgi:hypothetical protein